MSGNPALTSAKKADILPTDELSAFCRQMAHIMRAGISVPEGLSLIGEQVQDGKGRQAFDRMIDTVQQGDPFYAGLEAAGCFPAYMVEMIRMGETVGRLEEVFASLSEHYDRETRLSEQIKASIRYPMAMLVMTVLVLGVLLIEVLPVFNEVYRKLGVQLSGVSQGLLRLGEGMSKYSIVIAAVVAVIACAVFALRSSEKGRLFFGSLWTRFPLTRGLVKNIAVARFSSAMSMMLSGGYNPEQALEMAAKLVTDPRLREKVDGIMKDVDGGESLKDAMMKTGLFQGLAARLLRLGFQTGAIDQVMRDVAINCQSDADESLQKAVSMIEPTLVAVLAVLVGMVMLSVILPLLGVMNTLL